jgi:hypothetical protein
VRFTVHGSWTTYAGVFVGLTVIETPLVHLALRSYPIAAWVLTELQIYGVWWLVTDAWALARGGVFVGDDVEVRIGKRWRGRFARDLVLRVERGEAREPEESFAILGANVVLVLSSPVVMRGPFGIRREVSRLALSIDDPEAFSGMFASAS